MSKKQIKEERDRLRQLACQTLEAYRNLNTVAAEASFGRNGGVDGDGLARAGELLEAVIAEIKSTTKSSTASG